jgi:hypothetical protein
MGICSDGDGTVYENLNPYMGDFEFCNYIMDNDVPGYENASWVWDRGFSTNNFDNDDTNAECPEGLDADCLGFCGGDAVLDACGNCNGDNSTCSDCAGVPNGDSLEDECDVCDSDSTNDCVQDCAGVWGGTTEIDECDICGGNNTTCSDCAGIPNGDSLEDECDVCDSDSTNDCVQDCNGIWGGPALEDICGTCNGTELNEGNCIVECSDEEALGCDNTCDPIGSELIVDECGICNGDNSTCSDCAGVPNGDFLEDECEVCDLDSTNDCVRDCNGEWGGIAEYDECITEANPSGICGGNNLTCTDCNDVINGNSWDSDCGCVGVENAGNDCDDCSEVPNGTSMNDECEFCNEPVCNNYGIPSPFTAGNNPCDEGFFPTSTLWNTSCTDCLGIPNGTAYENLLTGECELILSTDDIIPNQFSINKIYPNPFNPVVTISYGIPTSQYTEGHIYNLSGKLVHTLISQYQSAGNYSIKWNATGKPSGIYIFILKTDSEVKSQKLVLLK